MSKQKRLAKVEIIKSGDGLPYPHYWYRLTGGNGQIIFFSEGFLRRADARRAMRRAIQIIQSGQYKVEE